MWIQQSLCQASGLAGEPRAAPLPAGFTYTRTLVGSQRGHLGIIFKGCLEALQAMARYSSRTTGSAPTGIPLFRFAATLAVLFDKTWLGAQLQLSAMQPREEMPGEGRQRSSWTPGPTCPAHRLGAAGRIQRDLPRRAAPLDALRGTIPGLPQEDALSAPASLYGTCSEPVGVCPADVVADQRH